MRRGVERMRALLGRIAPMNRTRILALVTIVAMVAVATLAWAFSGAGDAVVADTPSTSTTAPSTSATDPPTTAAPTTTVAPTTQPPATVNGLTRGSSGPEVERLQRRLAELGYDPGAPDGNFGTGTTYAVWAFQKVHALPVDGVVTDQVWAALDQPKPPPVLVPDGGATRVEVDLRSQLLTVYQGDALRLVTHTSTGNRKRYCEDGYCGTAITPAGSFRFLWRVRGWRTSHLGQLYNPVYFTWSGIAVHGANSVPNYPASHGCVRIPMHIAEYFPALVQRGDPVYVLDGVTSVGPGGLPDATTTTTAPPDSTTSSITPPDSSTSTTAPPDSSSTSSSTSSSSSSTSSSSTSTTTTTTTLPTP
jgi:lipoprotein-anchoring transpeptidase ErfK/SrfK